MQPLKRIPLPDWAADPAVVALLAALDGDGAVSRFVGGAVRDTLAGRPVRDVDIATTGLAEDNLQRLRAAGITVHATGLKHGTITAVVNHQGFEITTLRKDLETDGRHAVVQATDDWRADAERRDFTMNAIFLDRDGWLYDPVGGYGDILRRRLRFIGDAERRVAEDYLRILRFFRFFAWYGGSGAIDPVGLAACAAAAGQIDNLARERIAREILKLLSASEPGVALATMCDCGVLAATLHFPADLAALDRLTAAEAAGAFAIDPLRRLAALCHGHKRADIEQRLSLSRHQARRLDALLSPVGCLPAPADPQALKTAVYYQGREILRDRYLLAGDAGQAIRAATLVVGDFPLKGRDLRAQGMAPGPALGRMLAALETWWLENDAQPHRGEILQELERRLTQPYNS